MNFTEPRHADTMTQNQKDRSAELYEQARKAMERLAEERLNLCFEARRRLNEARGNLEAMDAHRLNQPTEGRLL